MKEVAFRYTFVGAPRIHEMGMRATLILTLALSTSACRTAATRVPTSFPEPSGIVAVLDTMKTGWNTGNLPMYLLGYADDVTSRGVDGFVQGRSAAEVVMRNGFWKNGRPGQQLHYERVDVRTLSAGIATVTGKYVLTGGGMPDRSGWFTTVWTATANGWRCVHDHF